MSHRKHCRASGFTLLEVMIAITILSTGLLGLAALVAKTAASADSSRYTSTQSLLASAKLDELNQLMNVDPNITPTGATTGSLTADVTATVGTTTVDYFDNVQISNGSAGITESATDKDANGNTVYDNIVHNPNGTITNTQSGTAPAQDASTLTFTRRWVIERDPVVNGAAVTGAERITVAVTVNSTPPPPAFQMTMVRPYGN